jgi:hypothetical protein
MLETLRAADFETLPERRLHVVFGDVETALEIIDIQKLPQNALRSVPPFALLLRDNGTRVARPQDTYLYQHPVHGQLALFTVPIGPDAHGMRYEIIFN